MICKPYMINLTELLFHFHQIYTCTSIKSANKENNNILPPPREAKHKNTFKRKIALFGVSFSEEPLHITLSILWGYAFSRRDNIMTFLRKIKNSDYLFCQKQRPVRSTEGSCQKLDHCP
jgi:hypothetical protein